MTIRCYLGYGNEMIVEQRVEINYYISCDESGQSSGHSWGALHTEHGNEGRRTMSM